MWQQHILTEQDMYNLKLKNKIDKSIDDSLKVVKEKLYLKWTNYDELKQVQDKYEELLRYFYGYKNILLCESLCLIPLILIFVTTFFSQMTLVVSVVIIIALFFLYRTYTIYKILKKHLSKINKYIK